MAKCNCASCEWRERWIAFYKREAAKNPNIKKYCDELIKTEKKLMKCTYRKDQAYVKSKFLGGELK